VLKGISDERVRTDELGLAASVWEGWAVQEGKETNFPQMSDEISNGRAAAACPSCGRGSMAFTITDPTRWTRRSTRHTMTPETFF